MVNLYPRPSKSMAKDWLYVASQERTVSHMNEGNIILQFIPGFVVIIANTSELK